MIRNIVFDIGNVLVRWDTLGIVQAAFGASGDDARARRDILFGGNAAWHALNRGEYTEEECKAAYVAAGQLSRKESEQLFTAIYASQHLIDGTPELMMRLRDAGYRLFALTDNVREVIRHLEQTHAWWSMFEGVTNSAELGCLKPDPRMYHHLLDTNALAPEETVFFDDMPGNVAGAHAVGMHAFAFTDAAQAEEDLRSIGVAI